MTKMNKETAFNILFWTIIIISTLIFVVKSLIVTEISLIDEAHMVATSYRFYLGDAPLVEDWSPEQLHGIVLLPLIYIYHLFSKSNDGIFLLIRIVYLFSKFIILLYGCIRLREKNNSNLIYAGLLLWYFFTPYNIETLTYQFTPTLFLLYALIVLNANASIFEYFLMGIFYALSILSQPFWVISYIFIFIWLIFHFKKLKMIIFRNRVIFFHLGIIMIFMTFIIFVFFRASFSDIIINVPYIFSEQDHNFTGHGIWYVFKEKICMVFLSFLLENKVTTVINAFYLIILCVLRDKRDRIKWLMYVCLGISCISVLFSEHSFLMNMMFIPFIWTGIENLFYVNDRRYCYLLTLGFLYTLSVALGTNTGVFATSASLSIYSCIVLFNSADDFSQRWCKKVSWISLVSILGLACFLRIYVTWHKVISPNDFNNHIPNGPMKGLYTDDIQFGNYIKILNDIDQLEIDKTKDILFCGSQTPIAYIYAETEYGTMGTPFFSLNYERLNKYLDCHPNKIPTAVYYIGFTDKDVQSDFWKTIMSDYEIVAMDDSMLAKIRE